MVAERVVEAAGEAALVHVTETQLKKAIMDAHQRVRSLFVRAKYHDYELQAQGTTHRELRPFQMVLDDRIIETKVSLYRPDTKNGDPRMWIYGARDFLEPGDILALFVVEGTLHGLNISRSRVSPLRQPTSKRPSLVKETAMTQGDYLAPVAERLLRQVKAKTTESAAELLARLRTLASAGLHRAVGHGDTAVGRTLETLLGIKANAKKTPDFRGIELKAGRSKSSAAQDNRVTLFAQVPDWDISECKSSKEILERFGYWRESAAKREFKLYVTVALGAPNSRGLLLYLAAGGEIVEERHRDNRGIDQPVAAWRLATLHKRLIEKHAETFWIKAESITRDGVEHFRFTHATHTRGPSVGMFDTELAEGTITLDHLIKGVGDTGLKQVREKGPLWKVERDSVQLLFPSAPTDYFLTEPSG